jgi:D-threo-aldose 1-dehydrogenase
VNHADVAAQFIRTTGRGPDCILLAGRYNLLDQSGADELLPLCHHLGIPVLAAGVFQGGALADHGVVQPRLRALCSQYGVPLLAAAVQFPLTHPAVPAVVVGARSPQEITEVAQLLEFEIPAGFWVALEQEGLITTRAGAG